MDAAFIHFGINTKYLSLQKTQASAGTGGALTGGYPAAANKVLSHYIFRKKTGNTAKHRQEEETKYYQILIRANRLLTEDKHKAFIFGTKHIF